MIPKNELRVIPFLINRFQRFESLERNRGMVSAPDPDDWKYDLDKNGYWLVNVRPADNQDIISGQVGFTIHNHVGHYTEIDPEEVPIDIIAKVPFK